MAKLFYSKSRQQIIYARYGLIGYRFSVKKGDELASCMVNNPQHVEELLRIAGVSMADEPKAAKVKSVAEPKPESKIKAAIKKVRRKPGRKPKKKPDKEALQ